MKKQGFKTKTLIVEFDNWLEIGLDSPEINKLNKHGNLLAVVYEFTTGKSITMSRRALCLDGGIFGT